MPSPPCQSGLDHLGEVRATWTPAELGRGPLCGADQDRRISGPAWAHPEWHGTARDALHLGDDLPDAEADAVAEVAYERPCRAVPGFCSRVSRRRRPDREQVRFGQVDDVNVIADRGPVWRQEPTLSLLIAAGLTVAYERLYGNPSTIWRPVRSGSRPAMRSTSLTPRAVH